MNFILSLFMNLGTLLLTFYSLCIMCDEHLVPAVEVFIKQFQVPEEVAAVTLVAFGSAAPELFLNSVSAFTGTSDLSLSAIMGSGMIAFGFIPPLCLLFSDHKSMQVRVHVIIRECGFYLIGLLIFLLSLRDGKIESKEAAVLIFIYGCYVTMVLVLYWNERNNKDLKKYIDEYPEISAIMKSSSNSSSVEKLEELKSLIHKNRVNNDYDVEKKLMRSNQDIDDDPSMPLVGTIASRSSSGEGRKRLISSSASSSERNPTTFSPTFNRRDDMNYILDDIDETDHIIDQFMVEDVDDANPLKRSKNRFYERLFHHFHHIVSTPIREVLKILIPTLEHEFESNSYNLFNYFYFQYFIKSTLYTTVGTYFAVPTTAPSATPSTSIRNRRSPVMGKGKKPSTGNQSDLRRSNSPSYPTSPTVVAPSVSPPRSPVNEFDGTPQKEDDPELQSNNLVEAENEEEEADGGDDDSGIDHESIPVWRAFLVVFVCIVGISISASAIVYASESLMKGVGIDSSVMGVTLVAFGSEIPDTISAISLARNGYHDGAIAGAIGSQVINISLGVGVPSLFICLTGKGYLKLIKHEADSLWFLACLLFLVISSFLILTVPFDKFRNLPVFTTITKQIAMIQISVCIIIYCIFLTFN